MLDRLQALGFTFVTALVLSACAGDAAEDEGSTDAVSEALTNPTRLMPVAVTGTPDDGNVPANVLDGKLGTRWSSEGDGASLRFDLGATRNVGRLSIAFYKGTARKSRFDIETSNDGATWTTKRSGLSSSGKTTALETFDFSVTAARHVRIVGHGNTENAWSSYTEVQLWGEGAVTPPPPPTTPPPPPPPPGGGSAPSDRLDLKAWKITLPVKGSGSSPLEVLNLAKYTLDPWFVVDPNSATGVRFRANAGGYTTSNSSYPRSELREMTASGGQASWSTSSGRHTMTIRETITQTPKVKPHVVAGQIHDAEDDVIMIRLEGSRLFVEGGGSELGLLDAAYKLGKPFTVQVAAEAGVIRVSYEGTEKVTYKRSVGGCYFKAGVYTQSNTSKGDAATAYGEVIIHSLQVTHQ
jgi:hypothetical protein